MFALFSQIAMIIAASALIFAVIWIVYGSLRSPIIVGRDTDVHTIISVSGSAEGLEQTLEGLLWLRENGIIIGQIAVVDCGLTQDGQILTRLLLKKYETVALQSVKGVEDWLMTKTN